MSNATTSNATLNHDGIDLHISLRIGDTDNSAENNEQPVADSAEAELLSKFFLAGIIVIFVVIIIASQ
jgi:hypothetical protein